MQDQDQDIADALSASLAKDGQTTPTANIPFGGFKATNVGTGTVATDAANVGQIQAAANLYVVASGTDTYTATPSPSLSAYANGQFQFVTFTNANTAAGPTINFNSIGALTLVVDGSTSLPIGAITAGMRALILVDASNSRAHVIPSKAAAAFGLTDGGDKTSGFTAAVNTRYTVNISGGGTITLPASATAGDTIVLALGGSVSYTLGANGLKINTGTADLIIPGNQTLVLIYTGATNGWV